MTPLREALTVAAILVLMVIAPFLFIYLFSQLGAPIMPVPR